MYKRQIQYGSLPGKGQIKGKRQNERILRRALHHKTAAATCDVRKAYPSTTVECVMTLLRRDIGKNKVLLWLVEAIMAKMCIRDRLHCLHKNR